MHEGYDGSFVVCVVCLSGPSKSMAYLWNKAQSIPI